IVQRMDVVQNMPNAIVFHQYESTVDPSLLFVLKWNASYIRAFPSAKVKIVGHSTDYSSNVKDEALAMERAQNVRTVLFLLGVPFENTDIISEGSREPAFEIESSGVRQARNNRVDIFYTANPPKGYHMDTIPVVKVSTYEQRITPIVF
ncbi:MAG: OmpA family protein, partial [Burkholderiales bacterium]|nr:OmpA family protein [Burkholderiales bacterium]